MVPALMQRRFAHHQLNLFTGLVEHLLSAQALGHYRIDGRSGSGVGQWAAG